MAAPPQTPSTKATRSVFVSNIAPAATNSKLSDFFSFCGRIVEIKIQTAESGMQEALIEFETDAAAKTALLLKDALIEGKPINVVSEAERQASMTPQEREVGESDFAHEGVEVMKSEDIQHKEHALPDSERSNTSVIASLLAAGYTMGNDSLQRAAEYDRQHQITKSLQETAQSTWNTVSTTAQQYDQQYNVSTTAKQYLDQASETVNPYWQTALQAATPYVESARTTAAVQSERAMENPTVSSMWNSLTSFAMNVQSQSGAIQEETKRKIAEEERKREAERAAAGGAEATLVEEDTLLADEPLMVEEEN